MGSRHHHWLFEQDVHARFEASLGLIRMKCIWVDNKDGIQLNAVLSD
jgi:hypothetical protein